MALIKCSECGNQVSDKANSCPNCGNPIAIDYSVKISFPQKNTFNAGCKVRDGEGNVLAKCKQGENAEFHIEKPTEIYVSMSAFSGKSKIIAEPGGRYKVNVRIFGTLAISKVDIL